MDDEARFVTEQLSLIEKKHIAFFADKDFTIYDCVKMISVSPQSIHVTMHDLPFDIRFEIESIFYL